MRQASIAILASGEGTTAESLAEYLATNQKNAKVDLVISNNENAGVFDRMRRLNEDLDLRIECVYIGKGNFPALPGEMLVPGQQTKAEEHALLDRLSSSNFDLILLLGYMKLIGPALVHAFGWRENYTVPTQAKMLNTHPGLLPETKGLYGIYVQQYVLESKLPHAGQTLHIVSENYDEGPVIAEHKVPVLEEDTAESLFERVKQTEKSYLAADVLDFLARKNYIIGSKNDAI